MIAVVAEHDSTGSRYVEEILSQAGLTWTAFPAAAMASLADSPSVIVLAGDGGLPIDSRNAVQQLVRNGTALVTTGGTWGLDDLLGASAIAVDSDGFVGELDEDHTIVDGLDSSLHVFSGTGLRATSGRAIASLLDADRSETLAAAIVVGREGRGATVAIGPNIPASALHIQLGRFIDGDGIPAPDGTAPIDDGILKTDDGVVLDWHYDRVQTEGPLVDCPGNDPAYPDGDTPWFGFPIADELRAILLNAIHWAASESGHILPAVAAWPRDLPAVGLISHDSDGNLDAGAQSTLKVLDQAGISSTWCHMWGPDYPTVYDPATFPKILAAGHEFALHYNSVAHDGGTWGRDHLAWQAAFVKNEGGVDRFVSNKNHYLRWEGKVDYFYWLLDEGIQADQCKGPSKKGNVGYPHGSSLPWFPLDTELDAAIDVLEIPLQFQDLWLTAPQHLNSQAISQAVRHHGVAHFLYHQVHIHTRPEVATALLQTVEVGREHGLEWWTSAEINNWQRQRRGISVVIKGDRLVVTSPTPVPGVTITIPAASGPITLGNLPARSIIVDLVAGETSIAIAQ